MKGIVNGTIVMPDHLVEECALLYSDHIEGVVPIEKIPTDATIIDAAGGYIIPGLIDLHIHGYAGVDVSDADAEGLTRMSQALLRQGVTGYLATTMTVDTATLAKAWQTCRQAMAHCPNLLGVNAEGPFISPQKCGAQDPHCAIPPDPAVMLPYADVIRLTTIAPEWQGAPEAVRELTAAGITVAVGHTAADYDTTLTCIEAGATHATHLFNAMSPLAQREPGAVGAVLGSSDSCELIADNHHVHPALYEMVWRTKGWGLCLITDCLAAGGMPPGEYQLGGQPIVSDGRICHRPDGTLAGSAGALLGNLKNFYEATHLPLWDCVGCATANPADVLGLRDKGSLEIGKDADIVITDRDFGVKTTILGGDTVYQA